MKKIMIIPPKLTKAAIEAAGTQYAHKLLDAGDESILDAYMPLRALRDAVDQAIKGLASDAMEEADQHSRDDWERLGVKFQVRDGRALYDFSQDSTWQVLKEREKRAADERKKREAFLKALDKDMVDPETGEFVSPALVKGYARNSLALTFPRG